MVLCIWLVSEKKKKKINIVLKIRKKTTTKETKPKLSSYSLMGQGFMVLTFGTYLFSYSGKFRIIWIMQIKHVVATKLLSHSVRT